MELWKKNESTITLLATITFLQRFHQRLISSSLRIRMEKRRRIDLFFTSGGVTQASTSSGASVLVPALPTEEEDVCSVCLDPLIFTGPGKKPETVTLGCGHQLHVACFVPCTVRVQSDNRRNSLVQRCPLCRRSFTQNLKNVLTDCYRRRTQDDLQPSPSLSSSLSGSSDYDDNIFDEQSTEYEIEHNVQVFVNGVRMTRRDGTSRPHQLRPLSDILQTVGIADEQGARGGGGWVTVEQTDYRDPNRHVQLQPRRIEAFPTIGFSAYQGSQTQIHPVIASQQLSASTSSETARSTSGWQINPVPFGRAPVIPLPVQQASSAYQGLQTQIHPVIASHEQLSASTSSETARSTSGLQINPVPYAFSRAPVIPLPVQQASSAYQGLQTQIHPDVIASQQLSARTSSEAARSTSGWQINPVPFSRAPVIPLQLVQQVSSDFEVDAGSFTIGSSEDSHRDRRNNRQHRARRNHGN
ncbi:hypothetical protein O6H91_09G012300 [Diphasiastrum complanatum]|uniref:Uncharacterized protein n=1 Tax=Diphasiastrum complanatum TaxID=34168 RepID=A0ACC2CL96_DIPCM|nr:hypothetical protein O6H91_09G012300 [Diphasiastrum complanatum]